MILDSNKYHKQTKQTKQKRLIDKVFFPLTCKNV